MRVALLAVAAAAAVVVAAAQPAGAGTSSSSCLRNGRTLVGGGPLEWKPTGRRSPLMSAGPALPYVHSGNTLLFTGITRIGGSARRTVVAFNARTLRPLSFNPGVPQNHNVLAMTASPTTVYVAHRPFADEEAPIQIQAFDLRTGALKPEFNPPDFRDGLLGEMVYVAGRVIIGGAPPFGPGITLGGYDPATGARLWQSPIDWPVRSLQTDGSRVFVEVDNESEPPGFNIAAAVNPADGQPIPGWGSSLPKTRFRTTLVGADSARVYFSTGSGLPDAIAARDGRPVNLPQLPSKVGLLGGPGGVILGRRSVRLSRGVNAAIGSVFSSTGKLIGSVCGLYQVIAMTDARHIVAAEPVGERARLIELVRPRR
jgi:hypothetical protein